MKYRIFIIVPLIFVFFSAHALKEKYVRKIVESKGTPTSRHENDFIEADGKFYLIDGRGIKPMEIFNPVTNPWIPIKYAEHCLIGTQAIVYHNNIYFAAGCGNRRGSPELCSMEINDKKIEKKIQDKTCNI